MLAVVLLSLWAVEPPLRAWCVDAATIVVAVPLDPRTPVRFRVTQTLRGQVKPGSVLAPGGLAGVAMQTYDEPDFETDGKPRPRRCTQALLFLDAQHSILALRLCTEDGRVMALRQGVLQLVETRWPVLLQRVVSDVATVDRLQGDCRLADPDKRAAAILGWIERHREDFRAGFAGSDEAPSGWGPLRTRLFDAIYDTGDPSAAWTAVRYHARLFDGKLLKPRGAVFESAQGKALLRRVAQDAAALSGDRVRAITLLGVDACLRDLLNDKVEEVRIAAAQMLGQSSDSRDIAALEKAYQSASPGAFRSEVAWSLARVAPSQWRKRSKNPQAVCVVLREVEKTRDGLEFWLHACLTEDKIVEAPVFVLEELGLLDVVRSTKSAPVQFLLLPHPWHEGWNGEPPLPVRLELGGLQPDSRYRLRVEGVIGPKKEKWQSEAILFRTNPPSLEGRGQR